MSMTFSQMNSIYHSFYQNGLFLNKRQIVIGSNPLKEDNELTNQDFLDFTKSMIILEDTKTLDEGKDKIVIYLTTYGGDVYEAFGYYDIISSSSCLVEVRCLGYCMSAGTIILQAADTRVAYANTSFMIHDISVTLDEDIEAKKLKLEEEEISRLKSKMKDIYLSKSKLNMKTLDKLLAQDSLFDSTTAKKYGLIDEIIKHIS